jgi:LysR family transcriptional regulator, glycine cleavage system transcriptional activator
MTVTNHGIAIHQTLMGHGILLALDQQPLSSQRGEYLVTTTEFLNTRIGKPVLQTLCGDVGVEPFVRP